MSDEDARRLARASLAAGDPTGWFEELYAQAQAGTAGVPWDLPEPSSLLTDWAQHLVGGGRRAAVVGCGTGRDAEFIAARGFATTAFDIAPTAIEQARARHPGSAVRYQVADLFDLPAAWDGAFELVVESVTVQALPPDLHARASAAVASLVATGGTLVVLGRVGDGAADGPPWPLTRAELDGFAVSGVRAASVEAVPAPDGSARWRAVYHRAATPVRLTALVSGRVQGVGFRYWVARTAEPLGLVGAATNLPNGRVEVVAEGSRSAAEQLLAALRGDDPPGYVGRVEAGWTEATGGFTGFRER